MYRSQIQVLQTQSAFIRAHNETLSIVAMRVNNPDGSSARIDG
jgi:hypothetical protein